MKCHHATAFFPHRITVTEPDREGWTGVTEGLYTETQLKLKQVQGESFSRAILQEIFLRGPLSSNSGAFKLLLFFFSLKVEN